MPMWKKNNCQQNELTGYTTLPVYSVIGMKDEMKRLNEMKMLAMDISNITANSSTVLFSSINVYSPLYLIM